MPMALLVSKNILGISHNDLNTHKACLSHLHYGELYYGARLRSRLRGFPTTRRPYHTIVQQTQQTDSLSKIHLFE